MSLLVDFAVEPEAEQPVDPKQDWAMNVQRAREIVAKRNAGEEISSEEKQIVFEVVNEAIKGMSNAREQELSKRAERVEGQAMMNQPAQPPVDPRQVPPEGPPQQAAGGEYYPPMNYR